MRIFLKLRPHQQAVLALIISNIIWGAASPIFKWSLENVPLFVMAFLRFFGASLLLAPFAFKKPLVILRSDYWQLAGIAFFGITINIVFFFLGLKNAPSINAPIIASAGPIFLMLLSHLFLKENVSYKTVSGTLISLLGVLLIIARPLIENGFAISALIGNLFFVVATLGAVAHTIFSKEILHRYHPLTITFWSFLIGSLTFFPGLVWQTFQRDWLHTLDIRGFTGLTFGIFLSSALAYFLYEWGVEKIQASEVGIFTYIDPLVATVIAIPLLNEVVTPLFILGAFLVFAGIFVAEGRLHYHPFQKLKPH